MKFFGWMQNKFNGKQGNAKPNPVPPARHVKQESREEFSDWPNGLLAIGTFGNNDLRQNHEIQAVERDDHQQVIQEEEEEEEEDSTSPSDDLQDFTPEEIGKLQKELTKLLTRKPTSDNKEKVTANLPLDRFLNCPSSLDISRRMSSALVNEVDEKEDDIERTISIILGRCKDICESKKKSIGRKSISFLLKKMFVCRSGFAPQPSLRDTFQESRMEKLLRTLLHKKINHPQNSPRASSMKKCLRDKQSSTKEREEEEDPRRVKITDNGSKWVRTDSEYIVLEI